MNIRFDNTFVRNLAGLYTPWHSSTASSPELLILNDALCKELGLNPDLLRDPKGVSVLVGNEVPEGASTCAMAYGGHQFGFYSKLGDGRALLLGEILDRKGGRRDLHLKGTGLTPYARSGDGKAAIGPMLREYLMGEAMYHLGIPTTRALSVVETGDKVKRTIELPGAVLMRVAASHIRVGTFEYASRSFEKDLVKRLADYAINRHYPHCKQAPNPYISFFEAVCEAQARLIAGWMQVGFIHGVMNTDNVTVSGETIDYGPCAFMDQYDSQTVFSSIDDSGRYSYGNQPSITEWNLMQLSESMKDLLGDSGKKVLKSFKSRYDTHWLSYMRAKLGLANNKQDEQDTVLINDLLKLMESEQADFTACFRSLSAILRGHPEKARSMFSLAPGAFEAWVTRWLSRLPLDTKTLIADHMDSVNPIYIARNHHVEAALTAATGGNLQPFLELLEVLSHPFTERLGLEKYAGPGPISSVCYKTYCGT